MVSKKFQKKLELFGELQKKKMYLKTHLNLIRIVIWTFNHAFSDIFPI